MRHKSKKLVAGAMVSAAVIGIVALFLAPLFLNANAGKAFDYEIKLVGNQYTAIPRAPLTPFAGPDFATIFGQVEGVLSTNKGANGYGTVYLSSPTYAVNSGLVINTPNIEVFGQGLSTELDAAPNNFDIFTIAADNVKVHDLYLKQFGGIGGGIMVSKSTTGVSITNDRIDNAYHGIYALNAQNNLVIDHNTLVSCGIGEGSIVTINSSGTPGVNLKVTNNNILQSPGHGIEIYGSTAVPLRAWNTVTVSGNTINQPALAGIFLAETTQSIVNQNQVLNAGAEALDFEHSTFITVDSNTVVNAHQLGISVLDLPSGRSSDITITNNAVSSSVISQPGVFLRGTDRILFQGNQVNGPNDGIAPNGMTTSLTIKGNKFTETIPGTRYGIRMDVGQGITATNTIIDSNTVTGYAYGLAFLTGGIYNSVTFTNNNVASNQVPVQLNATPQPFTVSGNTGYP